MGRLWFLKPSRRQTVARFQICNGVQHPIINTHATIFLTFNLVARNLTENFNISIIRKINIAPYTDFKRILWEKILEIRPFLIVRSKK